MQINMVVVEGGKATWVKNEDLGEESLKGGKEKGRNCIKNGMITLKKTF